jgi:glyoxylase-like metal-dependent hydrolase (beta-lactamase superfamily II)
MSPGHTSDSICLWLPEERALFSGDSILGEGKSPVLDDLSAYFDSMHSLLAKLESHPQPVTIYPGHGQMIADGVAAIQLALSKRESRNKEIVSLLKTAPWITVEQITNEVYKKVPPELRIAAIGTVKRHLTYLEQSGKVARRENEEGIGQYALKTDRKT